MAPRGARGDQSCWLDLPCRGLLWGRAGGVPCCYVELGQDYVCQVVLLLWLCVLFMLLCCVLEDSGLQVGGLTSEVFWVCLTWKFPKLKGQDLYLRCLTSTHGISNALF